MSHVNDLLAQALSLPDDERVEFVSKLLLLESGFTSGGRGAGIWGLLTLLETLVEPVRLGAFRCKATAARIERIFGQDAALLGIYAQQLGRWKNEPLTENQFEEVERLTSVVAKSRNVVSAILELARELEAGTTASALERIEQVVNGARFDPGIS
ncbi:hypothetical protein LZC95_50910 [Pendulispora brunnea]|uniref:Uncharacterized protein n=1 Tax=Pendulispora brunnea TaxID=2905690 RepID=A0ABZ2KCX7_9BACT